MKTLHHLITGTFRFLLVPLVILCCFSHELSAQGKKVYVGTGTGFIDYPNAQATLNLKDDDTVMINPGKYKLMNFRNITASPGHKIYIMNSGQVEFNDPSPSTFSNLTNVEIRGDGTPGIDFGFYMHDLIRAISIDGTMSGVSFSYIKMVNIIDYCIYLFNPSLVYNGTNDKTSLFYDLKFMHFSVYNIMTTFLQVGVYTRVVDDGLINMVRKLEVGYCTVDYTDQEDVLHLNKVVNANIHHNRFTHLGKNDFRHTGIVYLYGNGDVHHNYISDYWGSGLRVHGFSLDAPGEVRAYDNVMVNSRKYSGMEVLVGPEDLIYSSYLHYCNFKIYNNTFGNLSALDWHCSMVDTYDAQGGTIEIKNNIGFNIQRDLPYDPSWNFIYQQLNVTKPDTSNNIYRRTYTDLGLRDDTSCMLNSNSPAIDKGIAIGLVTDDIDGISRPQNAGYDMGAREYVTGVVYPVAKAGRDTTTILPKDSIVLNGSSSYNPGGGTLTYKWVQLSGPSAAVMVADTSSRPLLKGLKQGTYQLKLTVTNPTGQTAPDTILVVVSPQPVYPPVAHAGGTINITLPVNSTGLDGSTSASTNGALKYAWSKISGPASFTISGDTTAKPFVSSLTEGTYKVKLTVTDTSRLAANDTATIVVNPAPAPVANAGADVNLILPSNATTLDGTASTGTGGALKYVWTKVSGPATYNITADSTVRASVTSLVEGVYQFKLTVTNTAGISNSDFVNVTVVATPKAVAVAGADVNLTLPANNTTLNGSSSYSTGGGALIFNWSVLSGPAGYTVSGAGTAAPVISNLSAGNYQVQLKVTNIQGAFAYDTLVINVSAMTVYTPVSNAGPDVNITLPSNSTGLNGEPSYNPGGGALTFAWTKISGPSSFSISGAGTATPTVSSLTEGAYQVQLRVTNVQGISSQDTVTITVSPAPATPPAADAGTDINLTLPANTTALNGTASHSNDGGNLTYAWSQVSGPAAATITAGGTATPTLSNLVQGVYQIKLIVTSARGLTAQDVVSVTVNAPAYPVANAGGADIGLVLPANSVTLNGGASYDPAGNQLSYTWTKVDGPTAFSIANGNTPTPVVSNLTMGTYEMQLTVTNASGLSASDMVKVVVTTSLLAVPDAGHDTTITFPNGYAILNGTHSYTTGDTILHFMWKQVSGPTVAVINKADASLTQATNLEPGLYVFQLTVTDNYGQKANTTFKVTVVSATHHVKILTLYPNPCVDRLHIHAITSETGSMLVRVTNMAGIVVLTQTFQKNQMVFDDGIIVSQLRAGMYLVEMIIGKETQLQAKFMKR